MANEVYANGREISCKAGSGKSIAAFPDVCFTPPQTPATPPGVPIPYPNTGMASDCTEGSKTVQISGQEVMLKDQSYYKKSSGDEAGSAPKKGVITSQITGKVFFTAWSMDVKFEGQNVDRHLDLTTHNHGSGPNTPPMANQDAAASADAETCQDKKDNFKKECDPPKMVDDKRQCSEECCEKQKCQPVAKKDDKKLCCDPARTGHHIVPKAEFLKKAGGSEYICKYNPQDAPCVCVTGTSWHNEDDEGALMEHGQMHSAYFEERKKLGLKVGDPASYSQLSGAGAKSSAKVFGCDEKCMKEHLDDYHTNKAKADVSPDKPVCRVSDQKRVADIPDPEPM